MNGFRVQIGLEPEATRQVVSSGLREFNHSFLGQYCNEPIAVDVCGEDGEILGGAVGTLQLGWLFIDILWIPESLRSEGIGARVLAALELEAIQRGAGRAILDTMSFQAERFYIERGYVECGRVVNFASSYDRVFMTKNLEQADKPALIGADP